MDVQDAFYIIAIIFMVVMLAFMITLISLLLFLKARISFFEKTIQSKLSLFSSFGKIGGKVMEVAGDRLKNAMNESKKYERR